MRREWIEMSAAYAALQNGMSPSMRREWIEMVSGANNTAKWVVSLHAEGVD